MSLLEIPDQLNLKRHFTDLIKSNKVPNSILLYGEEGCSALPMGLYIIKYIFCKQKQDDSTCNRCSECKKIDKFINPDIHFYFPIGKHISKKKAISARDFLEDWKNMIIENPYLSIENWAGFFGDASKQLNISKDESRDIIKTLSMKTHGDGYKIIFIWLPEYLHIASSNSLLKIVEEPPNNTLFIFVSHNIDNIPKTLLSRMQSFYIPKYDNFIKTHPISSKNLSSEESNDPMGYDSEDSISKKFIEWMRFCYARKLSEIASLAEEFAKLPKITQIKFLNYAITMNRNILFTIMDDTIAPQENKEFYKKISDYLSPQTIDSIINEIETLIMKLNRNANPKIAYFYISTFIMKKFIR